MRLEHSSNAEPQTSRREHPHLFFSRADLEQLRRKTEHPTFKRDWEAILRAAEDALKAPLISQERRTLALSQAAGTAGKCAFVYRMTGEERFCDRARAICDAVLAADGWTGDYLDINMSGAQFHLDTGGICHGMALFYDMLAPEMTGDERRRFADTCYEKALKVYLEECRLPRNAYLSGHRTMNWLSAISSGAGCLFIALDGDGADYTREIEIARAHLLRFIEWYDDDGSAIEHGAYWAYGMGNALHFLQALKHNGWPGILQQRSRKLQRAAYPILYGCIGGKYVANFSDEPYAPLILARNCALLLAAEFQDSHLQWWADQLPPAGVLGFVSGDADLEPAPPDDLPTCMVFPRTGIGILRQSLSDPQTLFLAIRGGRARGRIYDDPHCQFDLNAVILDAFGVSLLADPGYGHDWTGDMPVTDPRHPSNATPPHNTILIDGRGQEVQWSPIAHLTDLSPSAEIDYIVSRIEQGYGPKVARFDRHAYLVDKRFYVLVDDVELTSPGTITWNFHGAKGAAITATQPATITHDGVELFITPQGATQLAISAPIDHVLPRLQWDTAAKVERARIAWLLQPRLAGAGGAQPIAELQGEVVLVSEGEKQWRLPLVVRRVPLQSSMTLIRQRER